MANEGRSERATWEVYEKKTKRKIPDTYLQILVTGNKAQRIRPRNKEWAERKSVTVFQS